MAYFLATILTCYFVVFIIISSWISLLMPMFFNEIPRGNLCKFNEILLLMYCRMP